MYMYIYTYARTHVRTYIQANIANIHACLEPGQAAVFRKLGWKLGFPPSGLGFKEDFRGPLVPKSTYRIVFPELLFLERLLELRMHCFSVFRFR